MNELTKVHKMDLGSIDWSRTSDDELLSWLNRIMEFTGRIAKATTIAIYQLGLILNEVKRRPSIWAAQYGHFSRFVTDYIMPNFGVSRSTVYQAMRIAERWPRLSTDEVASIGTAKLALLARIGTQDGDPNGKLIEKASSSTLFEFREWAIAKGLLDEMDGVFRTLRIPAEIYEDIMDIVRSTKAHELVGTDNPFEIMKAMVQEVRSSWGI